MEDSTHKDPLNADPTPGTVLKGDCLAPEGSLGQEETTRVQKAAAALKQADLEQSNEPPQSFTRPTEDGWEKQPNTTETEADTQTSQASPFEGPPSVSGESPAAVAGGKSVAFVEDVNELPTVVPGHRRSASLEVETGSFSAPESAKLDQDMSSEDATSEIPLDGPDPAAATDEQALAPSNKSVASEEGTVITHSTPDSTASTTRKELPEEPGSMPSDKPDDVTPTGPVDQPVLTEPFTVDDLEIQPLDGNAGNATKNLEADFPGTAAHTEAAGRSISDQEVPQRKVDSSRPGVTSSPPRSPKQDAPNRRPAADEPLPEASSFDKGTVTDELAEAEARADLAALAASQRASSLGKQSLEEGPNEEDAAAPFTEEALSADEKRDATPPPTESPPARPFSPPPGGARTVTPDTVAEEQSFEPAEFRGLVFHDGVDALGRPVIVINADAVPPKVSRKAACTYMLQRLEPIVIQGPYVLVFLNTGKGSRSNKLPAGWLAASYREMSYPFKKNVKHVILVRPSATLNFMLTLMRPLISRKAYVKLKKVDSLTAMAAATNSEVTLQHLGPRFAASAGQAIIAAEGLASQGPQAGLYQMPTFGEVELSENGVH